MDRLPITDVQAYTCDVPLHNEWRIALYAARTRAHCVVVVTAADGTQGVGEVAPSAAFMGEDGHSATGVIQRNLVQAVRGRNAFDLAGLHVAMDGAIKGNGAAKAAVDLAVHDLLGRVLDLPVHVLLGGQVREQIPVTWCVSIQQPEQAVAEIAAYRRLGIKTFKIKLGRGHTADLALMNQIREAHPEMRLRVDLNQGYHYHEVLPLLRALEPVGLDAIEQPVPAWDLEGMARLSSALDTPIMADESVFDLHEAGEVARRRAASIFNIKVGKVGGLYRARQVAGLAEAFGLTCTVGSNLELAPGTAASIHFAAATPCIQYPSDLAIGHYLHQWDLGASPITITGGNVTVPPGPGLGVNLREDLPFVADRRMSS